MSMKIFTNQYDATETWSTQGATVLWGKGTEVGNGGSDDLVFPLLMGGISLTYGRRAQEVAAINTNKDGKRRRYRIYDAPNGVLNITSIFSPYAKDLKNFLEAVTKDCKKGDDQVWMTLSPFGSLTCVQGDNESEFGKVVNNPTFGKFGLKDVDLEQLGLQIQAGQGGGATITMPLSFSFSNLLWDVE
jgi:hypothetical protein